MVELSWMNTTPLLIFLYISLCESTRSFSIRGETE
jgi:hypothetical protein